MGIKFKARHFLVGSFLMILLLSFGSLLAGSSTYLDDETSTETEPEEEDGDDGNDAEKDDDDGDDVDDNREAEAERELTHIESEDEFKIESKLKTGDATDEFEVEFKLEDEPSIEFNYQNESESLETELEFEVEFISLIEFNDSNNNGYYDNNDTVYSTYDFSNALFEVLQYQTSTTLDNESLYEVWTQTTDGIFLIRLYVVSGFGLIHNATVTPTEAKIDIEINNYNYTNNGNLALQLELNSEVETEIEKGDESPDEAEGLALNEEALSFSSSSYMGFFSWDMTAIVDGVERQVVSGPYESKENETEDAGEFELELKGEIVLCYPHGTKIIHDPKLGIVTETVYDYAFPSKTSGTAPTSFKLIDVNGKVGFIGLTAVATLVLCVLLVFNRRRGSP